jgi:hypothetical protein
MTFLPQSIKKGVLSARRALSAISTFDMENLRVSIASWHVCSKATIKRAGTRPPQSKILARAALAGHRASLNLHGRRQLVVNGRPGRNRKTAAALIDAASGEASSMSESQLPKNLGLTFGLLFFLLMALNSYAFQ